MVIRIGAKVGDGQIVIPGDKSRIIPAPSIIFPQADDRVAGRGIGRPPDCIRLRFIVFTGTGRLIGFVKEMCLCVVFF